VGWDDVDDVDGACKSEEKDIGQNGGELVGWNDCKVDVADGTCDSDGTNVKEGSVGGLSTLVAKIIAIKLTRPWTRCVGKRV